VLLVAKVVEAKQVVEGGWAMPLPSMGVDTEAKAETEVERGVEHTHAATAEGGRGTGAQDTADIELWPFDTTDAYWDECACSCRGMHGCGWAE